MKKIINVFLCDILIVTALFAQNKPYRVGTTACNFLEMGIGSAGNSMGEAYVSATRDLSSIYWNPSGLAYMENYKVRFMNQPWLVDTYIGFGCAALVHKMGKFAVIK